MTENKLKKIIITGGGTGGHVFPALALLEAFEKTHIQVTYVGSATGFESKVIPQKGHRFLTISSGAIKNQSFFKIIKTVFILFKGLLQSCKIILKEKPDAIIGVGGYVSAPICIAGFMLGVPIFLQEQNVSVGITNRLLGKLAKKVYLGFPQATKYFNPKKVLVSGNPLRKEIYQKNFPEIKAFKNLLVLGGSQGALAVNQVILDLLPLINESFPSLNIVHQTGEKDLEKVKTAYEKMFKGSFQVKPFIQNVFEEYEKADLVVSRSGALTVSEIIESMRPAIFVPYPRVGQNDQTANAYWLESLGCAGVVEQGEKFKERFWKTFQERSSVDTLKEMSKNLAALKQKPSSDLIVRDISETIECIRK